MAIKRDVFGCMPDKRPVERYTLTNKNGVSASFLTLGGIWHSMIVPDNNGSPADVALACADVESYLAHTANFGAPIGRNANRIGKARFTINGKEYSLAANDGANNLHSGPDTYQKRLWEAACQETDRGGKVTFSLRSPDGDQGYPGNADIAISYMLTEDNRVIIDYHLVCDADTVANMTNHAYFNLAGHEAGDILDQEVWIDADAFTAADAGSIPTGEIVPVEGTPMDFRVIKPIGREINADYEPLILGNGYDHNWVLNHPAGELSLCAKACDPASGRCLKVYTDLPGMQFYTGNFLKGDAAGKDGVLYPQRSGYCFETQYFPDAINKPQFASPLLKAGQEYKTTTIYEFTTE